MVHKITIEDGKDDLANQVAQNPVEEIVKSAPAEAQPAQAQSVSTSHSVELTEEERLFGKPEDEDKIFGTKEEAQRLFGDAEFKNRLS